MSIGGAIAAFVIGRKLGVASAVKAKNGLLSQTGISIASGVSSSISWKLYITADKYLEGLSTVNNKDTGSINNPIKFNDNIVLSFHTKLENKYKIIEMIEKQTNSSKHEIFKLNDQNINLIINSPLESS